MFRIVKCYFVSFFDSSFLHHTTRHVPHLTRLFLQSPQERKETIDVILKYNFKYMSMALVSFGFWTFIYSLCPFLASYHLCSVFVFLYLLTLFNIHHILNNLSSMWFSSDSSLYSFHSFCSSNHHYLNSFFSEFLIDYSFTLTTDSIYISFLLLCV